MNNKTVVVTGAGRGIGEAIARRFAAEGAFTYVLDINADTANDTAARINAEGGEARGVEVDVTDYQLVSEAFDAIVEARGGIDVLVNNAGWEQVEPFIVSTPSTWQKVIAINYLGVVNTCHVVLRSMIERRSGRIINIASDAGRVGSTGEAVYSGAKGGVIAFSKTLARETAREGIGVNVVCPGPTLTPLVEEQIARNPKLISALERAIPIGRMGDPDDLAGAVVFLGSDDASFITGQTLSVSGGLTMV